MTDVRPSKAEVVDSPPTVTDNAQASSAFLHKLPVEIRLQIYRLVFKGGDDPLTRSHLTWDCAKEVFSPTHHRNLLLTCRTIRQEATDQYYSSTVVDFQGRQEGVWISPYYTVPYEKLPAIAFRRTRRVLNAPISVPFGREETAVWHLGHLRRFERLKWCRTAPVMLIEGLQLLFTLELGAGHCAWPQTLRYLGEEGWPYATVHMEWDLEARDMSKVSVSENMNTLS